MILKNEYKSRLDSHNQEQLDEVIKQYDLYIVNGKNYSDIIVLKENFEGFINGLTTIGITIENITWWCKATEENKIKYGCPHGLGGPMTKFGWFSEIVQEFEDLSEIETSLFNDLKYNLTPITIKSINDKAIDIIQNKQTITYADGTSLTFKDNPCLTPGFDLCVPMEWRYNT